MHIPTHSFTHALTHSLTHSTTQVVNPATRMSINTTGQSLSDANTESFLAMEMRVKYLESQCEDAQAALARKHTIMQEAVDRLSGKQQEVDDAMERLEEAQGSIAQVV